MFHRNGGTQVGRKIPDSRFSAPTDLNKALAELTIGEGRYLAQT